MADCVICFDVAAPNRAACWGCHASLLNDLAEIAAEYERLDSRPQFSGGGGRRSPGFSSKSPANDHVISLKDRRTKAKVLGDLHNAHTFMGEWVMFVLEQRGMALIWPVSVDEAFRRLHAHWDWITRQEWVSDLAAQAHVVLGQVRSANGIRPPAKVGECWASTEDGVCGATIYAPASGSVATCPRCGAQYEAMTILEMEARGAAA